MKTNHLKLLLLALAIPLLAGGSKLYFNYQNVTLDPGFVLTQLGQFYSSHENIYHELSYQLYPDQHSTQPHSVESGIFIKQGKLQYAQLATIESLTTEEYTIGIDHEEKIVLISNHISLPPTGPLPDATTWNPAESDISIQAISDRLQTLTIKMETGEIREAAITYDLNNYQPEKMVLNYRRSIQLESDAESPFVQARLEIIYTRTNLEGQGKERLNMDAYILRQGEEWVLHPKYRAYQLINNIQAIPEQN